jgi:hypothetical protein
MLKIFHTPCNPATSLPLTAHVYGICGCSEAAAGHLLERLLSDVLLHLPRHHLHEQVAMHHPGAVKQEPSTVSTVLQQR